MIMQATPVLLPQRSSARRAASCTVEWLVWIKKEPTGDNANAFDFAPRPKIRSTSRRVGSLTSGTWAAANGVSSAALRVNQGSGGIGGCACGETITLPTAKTSQRLGVAL